MADNLLQIDVELANNVKFTMGTKKYDGSDVDKGLPILFQFPPKILTDSRTGSWFETEVPGDQPIATWKVSGARKWSLEWTYVIGANGWDINKVRTQIVNIRSYWTARENLASNFIVNFSIWKLGGVENMTCRLTNVDVTHGKALYIPTDSSGSPQYREAHPVITNIKVSMQLWTAGGNSLYNQATTGLQQTQGNLMEKLSGSKDSKMDLNLLEKVVPPDWN
jgi:hypothetical protein